MSKAGRADVGVGAGGHLGEEGLAVEALLRAVALGGEAHPEPVVVRGHRARRVAQRPLRGDVAVRGQRLLHRGVDRGAVREERHERVLLDPLLRLAEPVLVRELRAGCSEPVQGRLALGDRRPAVDLARHRVVVGLLQELRSASPRRAASSGRRRCRRRSRGRARRGTSRRRARGAARRRGRRPRRRGRRAPRRAGAPCRGTCSGARRPAPTDPSSDPSRARSGSGRLPGRSRQRRPPPSRKCSSRRSRSLQRAPRRGRVRAIRPLRMIFTVVTPIVHFWALIPGSELGSSARRPARQATCPRARYRHLRLSAARS